MSKTFSQKTSFGVDNDSSSSIDSSNGRGDTSIAALVRSLVPSDDSSSNETEELSLSVSNKVPQSLSNLVQDLVTQFKTIGYDSSTDSGNSDGDLGIQKGPLPMSNLIKSLVLQNEVLDETLSRPIAATKRNDNDSINSLNSFNNEHKHYVRTQPCTLSNEQDTATADINRHVRPHPSNSSNKLFRMGESTAATGIKNRSKNVFASSVIDCDLSSTYHTEASDKAFDDDEKSGMGNVGIMLSATFRTKDLRMPMNSRNAGSSLKGLLLEKQKKDSKENRIGPLPVVIFQKPNELYMRDESLSSSFSGEDSYETESSSSEMSSEDEYETENSSESDVTTELSVGTTERERKVVSLKKTHDIRETIEHVAVGGRDDYENHIVQKSLQDADEYKRDGERVTMKSKHDSQYDINCSDDKSEIYNGKAKCKSTNRVLQSATEIYNADHKVHEQDFLGQGVTERRFQSKDIESDKSEDEYQSDPSSDNCKNSQVFSDGSSSLEYTDEDDSMKSHDSSDCSDLGAVPDDSPESNYSQPVFDFDGSFRILAVSSEEDDDLSSEESDSLDIEADKELYRKLEAINRREDHLNVRTQKLVRKYSMACAIVCCLTLAVIILFTVDPLERDRMK